MKKDTLHQLLQIIIAILTALATSLTAQSCIKKKASKAKTKPLYALAQNTTTHVDDIQLLMVVGKDTTRVAAICTHEH